MKASDCPSYEGCDAPLCPLDSESIQNACWYADEPICGSMLYGKHLPWTRVQRKIARKKVCPEAGYFTVTMLSEIKRISVKMKGIDPDAVRSTSYKQIIDKH